MNQLKDCLIYSIKIMPDVIFEKQGKPAEKCGYELTNSIFIKGASVTLPLQLTIRGYARWLGHIPSP